MSVPDEKPSAAKAQIEELERALAAGELLPEQLIDRLSTVDWPVRRALVLMLCRLGDVAVPALFHALEARRDDEARIAALVDALVGSSADLEGALAQLADHDDPAVVADVAQILGRRRNPRGLPSLVRLTQHADDNVAVAAIEGLGRSGGSSAVAALIACVEGNNFFRVFPAIDVLGRSGDPRAIAPLSRLLGNPRYAFEAARALGRTADRAAVAPLLKLMNGSSEASVRVGCLALSELCERHAELYGVATTIESLLREGRSESLVRRLGQSLSGADRSEKIALCRVLGALQGGAALEWILPLLDGDPEVARAAGQALEEIGRDTDEAVDNALLEPHSARRSVLLPGITRSEHAVAVLACLDDSEPQVRALAAEALGRLAYAPATRALFALLSDASPRVVIAASAAIQALGSNETEQLALAAAEAESPGVRRAALRILAYFGYESALDLFAAATRAEDPRMRDAAVQGLSLLQNPRARQVLIDSAASADEKVRAAAMRALGQCEREVATRSCLLRGIEDPDAWVRYYAVQGLGRQEATESVEAIVRLLDDPAGQVRVAAVEALSRLSGAVALTALQKAARESDLDVRRAALLGLGMMRDPSCRAILLDAVRDTDAATRLVALSALANRHDDAPEELDPSQHTEVAHALGRAARDEVEAVRTAAIGFLQTLPGTASSRSLIELVREQRERTRALEALSAPSRPKDERVPALLEALQQADDELAPLFVSCLSRLQRVGASPDGLFRAFALDQRTARMAAAHGLSALGSRAAFAALSRAATEDSDPEVRSVCALHLAG